LEIPGRRGLSKAKTVKQTYGAYLEFPVGWGWGGGRGAKKTIHFWNHTNGQMNINNMIRRINMIVPVPLVS